MVERCSVTRRSRHLIFQNAPKVGSAGVGTVDKRSWLPRYHWAGPSTSLDEFTIRLVILPFPFLRDPADVLARPLAENAR